LNKAKINIRHTCESRYPEFGINGIGLSKFLPFLFVHKNIFFIISGV